MEIRTGSPRQVSCSWPQLHDARRFMYPSSIVWRQGIVNCRGSNCRMPRGDTQLMEIGNDVASGVQVRYRRSLPIVHLEGAFFGAVRAEIDGELRTDGAAKCRIENIESTALPVRQNRRNAIAG